MSKEENRSKMPTVAAFVDAVRAEFGDCKVVYAKENGIELGKKPERGIIVKSFTPAAADRSAKTRRIQ